MESPAKENIQEPAKGLTGFWLKGIACLTMLADHLAYTLAGLGILAPEGWVYEAMRSLGRLAFPLFIFLMAEGARYTKNPGKYLLRVLFLALASEIPFDLLFFGTPFDWNHQNVVWTLLFGLAAVVVLKKAVEERASGPAKRIEEEKVSGPAQKTGKDFKPREQRKDLMKLLASCLFSALMVALGKLFSTDYGAGGVLAVILMGLMALPRRVFGRLVDEDVKRLIFAGAGMVALCIENSSQVVALVPLIPILLLYNGRRGYSKKAIQIAFYLFYPLHLLLLWGISRMIG